MSSPLLTDDIRGALTSGRLGHLATANPDGSPQVSVVSIGLDGDDIVVGHRSPGGPHGRGAGIVLTFGMWWSYFAFPWGELLTHHRERSFFWGDGHMLIFGGIAATGAGLHAVQDAVEDCQTADVAGVAPAARSSRAARRSAVTRDVTQARPR
jgi:hypothetical protein